MKGSHAYLHYPYHSKEMIHFLNTTFHHLHNSHQPAPGGRDNVLIMTNEIVLGVQQYTVE